MSTGVYKAVCYRCSYEGRGTASDCPICQFPMILELENTSPGGRRVEDIFARHSVSSGAPLLPGVHAQKRKAQLMAEARRRRSAARRSAPVGQEKRKREAPRPPHRWVKIARPGRSALKLMLFCASAVVAGVVAAALQSGAL